MRTNSPEHLGHLVLDLFAEIELERKLRAVAKDAKNCGQRQLSRMAQISVVAQHLGATGVCMLLFEARELLRAHAVALCGIDEGADADIPPWDEVPGAPQTQVVRQDASGETPSDHDPRQGLKDKTCPELPIKLHRG